MISKCVLLQIHVTLSKKKIANLRAWTETNSTSLYLGGRKGLFESRCKLSPCPRKLLCACKRKWIGIADFETWCIVR